MKIRVTQEHIKLGKKGNPSSCPIALAIKELFPDKYVYVSSHIGIGYKLYPNPHWVQSFIESFDDGESVDPFEFEIGSPIGKFGAV